jgi:LPS-assembly protein
MNKLLALILFPFLIILLPLSVHPQDEYAPTNGNYPTENTGTESNNITPNRNDLGKFPKLKGPEFSNELKITSQSQNETRPNYYILEGYVDMAYQGIRLQSDHAEYDTVTKDLIATGNVVLDQEDQHITGSRLELNLDTKKGVMYNARGFVPPQIFFYGSKLEKLGEEKYKLHDAIFTECSHIVPHWKLNSTNARMTVNEYIHFHNFLLKAKTIPIFYSPYMMWPIKRERATGFLFPSFGPNSRKGFWVGGSFFWAMGKSMDTTYWFDHYQLRGWGGGTEYRYAASKDSDGGVKAYVMNDRLLGRQWTVNGAIKQDLPAEFQLAGIADYFSSYQYIRDYANNLQQALSSTKTTQAYVTRNWSYYSLNFLNNWSEHGSLNGNASSFYHVPEVEFQMRSLKIGATPLFASLLTSFDELGRGNTFKNETSTRFFFSRYDAFPSISFPMTYLSWLTFTPSFGERATHWTNSVTPDGVQSEPVSRFYKDLTLDLRGPNFSKIFDTPNMGYSQKWKHAIEPQITFRYLQNISEFPNIIKIDDVDFIQGERQVTYSLTNLLYAKRPINEQKEYEPDEYQFYNPKPLEEPPMTAWELISWKVEQSYRLNSDSFNPAIDLLDKRFSPITSTVRVNPAINYSIQFVTSYDLYAHQFQTIQLNSSLKNTNSWYSNLSYVHSALGAHDALQTSERFGLWKNRLVLSGDAGYNISDKTLLSSGLGIMFNDDCYSIGVEYKHFNQALGLNGKENRFTFSISLPNIGNLVNFQSSQPPSSL